MNIVELNNTNAVDLNITTNVVNVTSPTDVNKTTKTIPIIIGEGGEELPTKTQDKSTIKQSVVNKKSNTTVPRTYGREGEFELSDQKQYSSGEVNVTVNNTNSNSTTSTEASKPVSESPSVQKAITEVAPTFPNIESTTIRSRIVPKKGVNYTDVTSKPVVTSSTIVTAVTSTTVAPKTTVIKKIQKPTVTTGSDDEKDALVKVKSNRNSTPKVPTIEYYQNTKESNNRSTFIIPIIMVILSVPIVAIIINILYKRCKEWWSHRHYRRMDFLIDGMYNN
ncbi:hypothetical protein QE152_g14358 [Popillia japonica]|uniref:Uncharacterized protein n=1 Tax=Popillia japonica TaxID=7064 RepID=A0AAW1L6Z3_POPJA